MTSTTNHFDGVLVAVDGSEQDCSVVRYAATEAERLGARLDILHVLPGGLPVAPMGMPMIPEASFESCGAQILANAKEAALDAVATLEVGTHLSLGRRIQQLLAFAAHSQLIVLGNRSPRSHDRLWTGSTVHSVADRAACPVLVVPAEREPGEVHGRIAIGLKLPGQARGLFNTGFRLAARLNAELVVLHAWRLEGVYDDIIAHRTETEGWLREQTELIDQELAPSRAAFPSVPVRVFVRHEEPAHALVRVTRGADRLLIARPSHHGRGRGVGRVGRAVLREAHCPIEVLPACKGAAASASRGVERPTELFL